MRRSSLGGAASVEGTTQGAGRFGPGVRRFGATGWSVTPISTSVPVGPKDQPLVRRAFDDALAGGINLFVADVPEAHQFERAGETWGMLETLGAAIASAVSRGDIVRDQLVVVLRLVGGSHEGPQRVRFARAALGLDVVDGVLFEFASPSALESGWTEVRSAGPEYGDPAVLGVDVSSWEPESFEQASGETWARVFEAERPPELVSTTMAAATRAGHPWGQAAVGQGAAWLARDPSTLEISGRAGSRRYAWEVSDADAPGARDVAGALAELRKQEARWATGLGKCLVTSDGGDTAADLFAWGRQLGEVLPRIEAQARPVQAWRVLRYDQLAPLVGRTSAALLAALEGPARAEFADWWQRYGTTLHRAFDAIERWLGQRGASPHARVHAVLTERLPEACRDRDIVSQSVLAALSHPISSAAVPMSEPSRVHALVGLRDAGAALQAVVDRRVDWSELRAKIAQVLLDPSDPIDR